MSKFVVHYVKELDESEQSGWGDYCAERVEILTMPMDNPTFDDFHQTHPQIVEIYAIFSGSNLKECDLV